MDYAQALNYLFSSLPMYQRTGAAAYKEGLGNTLALDAYFNYPHRLFKTIHVAGTNGKGSVSHSICSVLMAAGYKTGLYTSPHLVDFRERIRVNGQMITQAEVVQFVNNHQAILEEIKPSFFEMGVAMAFDYFAREKVDIAVVEVGMGGRLDSTNIIDPLVSVITNIGLDHVAFLGNTLALIAAEKAGIIKGGVPVVVGETHPETEEVFRKKASDLGSPVYFADQLFDPVQYSTLSLEGKQIFTITRKGEFVFRQLEMDLLGIYQRKNILTILQSLEILRQKGLNLSDDNIRDGISRVMAQTGLMGRWQIVGANPLTVCDTGHNKDGILSILEQIKQTAFKQLHWVFGMVNDKDPESILKILPKEANYYFTKASIPRALDPHILAEKANLEGLNGTVFPNVHDAYLDAFSKAGSNDLIMIGGSTFVVADYLGFFQKK